MTGNARGNVAAALIASLLWSTAFIAPAAVRPASELLLVTGRYSLFGLCGLYVLWKAWSEVRKMPVRRIAFGLYLGFVGYFVFYICVAYSATMGSGFITAVIVGSSPIAIAIGGNFAEKRIAWRELAPSAVLILSGVALVTIPDYLKSEGAASGSVIAIGLAAMASLSWAYFVVRNAQSQRTWEVKPDPKIWSALVAMGAGSASMLLLPFAIATTPDATFAPQALLKIVLWCVFLGVIGSWWGTLIWVRAAKGIPAPLAGPLLATEPIFGAVLSLLTERKTPTWAEVAGCLCILAGVGVYLLFDLKNSRSKEEKTETGKASVAAA
ncbi:DMT family transporter [Streptomyces hokutonensis]|uniref:DMT family transporter n=1 Tax=Streptomyces hokutonensis TaxID=1306990 RepID=UPI00367D5C52